MIKNIIFDFGDIFINLDKTATAKAMEPFGFNSLTEELDTLFKNYEKGLVSSEAFLNQVSKRFPTATTDDLINAWNCILLDFPLDRLEFIKNLSQQNKFRLFLLSNTNDIHIQYVKEKMGIEKFNQFKDCFEVFYLSYEMKMRKPDTEIFEYVLQQNNLKATETFFIDDTKENTDAAAQLGIKVWNLQVGKEDITQLKLYL